MWIVFHGDPNTGDEVCVVLALLLPVAASDEELVAGGGAGCDRTLSKKLRTFPDLSGWGHMKQSIQHNRKHEIGWGVLGHRIGGYWASSIPIQKPQLVRPAHD